MKPLIVLISVFAISLVVVKLIFNHYDVALAARIAMSAMLLFTAVGHFAFTRGMTLMMPDFIPFKTAMVYVTGVIEIAAAIGLLIPSLQVLIGWLLIAFFALLLPVNIHAAIRQVDYQKGDYSGSGINYLWFRVPLQLLFIAWVYLSAIRY